MHYKINHTNNKKQKQKQMLHMESSLLGTTVSTKIYKISKPVVINIIRHAQTEILRKILDIFHR